MVSPFRKTFGRGSFRVATEPNQLMATSRDSQRLSSSFPWKATRANQLSPEETEAGSVDAGTATDAVSAQAGNRSQGRKGGMACPKPVGCFVSFVSLFVWFGLMDSLLGLDWIGLPWIGWDGMGLDGMGWDWIGLDWVGLIG